MYHKRLDPSGIETEVADTDISETCLDPDFMTYLVNVLFPPYALFTYFSLRGLQLSSHGLQCFFKIFLTSAKH